jgi:hypothetical protein
LTIEVDSVEIITTSSQITVTASDGEQSISMTIEVGSLQEFPAPIDGNIFELDETFVPGDTIKGFSSAVLSHPENLKIYNTLDFSIQSSVKYIDGNCNFSKDIIDS